MTATPFQRKNIEFKIMRVIMIAVEDKDDPTQKLFISLK